jgi:hypothetical protein
LNRRNCDDDKHEQQNRYWQAREIVKGGFGVMCSNNGGNHPAYRRDERADESSSVTAGGTKDRR